MKIPSQMRNEDPKYNKNKFYDEKTLYGQLQRAYLHKAEFNLF